MADVYVDVAFGIYHRTAELYPGVRADYDEDGRLIGVEVQNARSVELDGQGVLRFDVAEESENDDSGQ